MRVNVYGEELTNDVRIVEKIAETGIKHFGIRIFLESSTFLHNDAIDDDRSAVTFWAAEKPTGGPDLQRLSDILSIAANRSIELLHK